LLDDDGAFAEARLTHNEHGQSGGKHHTNRRAVEKLKSLHTWRQNAIDRPPPPNHKHAKSQSQKASKNDENTFCMKSSPVEVDRSPSLSRLSARKGLLWIKQPLT
jgi:hypothetical protein